MSLGEGIEIKKKKWYLGPDSNRHGIAAIGF